MTNTSKRYEITLPSGAVTLPFYSLTDAKYFAAAQYPEHTAVRPCATSDGFARVLVVR